MLRRMTCTGRAVHEKDGFASQVGINPIRQVGVLVEDDDERQVVLPLSRCQMIFNGLVIGVGRTAPRRCLAWVPRR